MITTSYISDYEYSSKTVDGEEVFIDMKDTGKTGQSPMQLVLSALCGCVAVEVALMLKKRRKQLDHMKIEATGVRPDQNPRGFRSITMHFVIYSPDAKVEELDKIINLTLTSYCSVADSLKAPISFTSEIIREYVPEA